MTRFAFIVHFLSIDDLAIAFPELPSFFIPDIKIPILRHFEELSGEQGFMIRSKFKIGKEVEGFILLLFLTGEQMMSVDRAHKVRNRILEAVLYAQNNLKCNVIGLGGLSASVTQGGSWLAAQPGIKTTLTHGDSYSVWIASQGIQEIARKTKLDLSKATVAILGATGLIGVGLVSRLAPLTKQLILIGQNLKKLDLVRIKAENLGTTPIVTLDIDYLKEADIVVTATSWPGALIGPNHLKKGAIIYEVARPPNASSSILEERPDVLIVDGCYVNVPEDIKFWWMGRSPFVTFACMAETIMQALAGDQENHIGEIDPTFVEEVGQRGEKFGFSHAAFTSFNLPIDSRRLADIGKTREMYNLVKSIA